MLSTIAILRQKRSEQPLALKMAALAQKSGEKICVIFGVPYMENPERPSKQENIKSFDPVAKNIGTYARTNGNIIRNDLDDYLAFYGKDNIAIGWLWPPMLVLDGTELVRWNNCVRTFLQRLAHEGFHYCLFEADWTARLSFALGWSIFDQRVLVCDPTSAFPVRLDLLPWYGKFILFLTPLTDTSTFRPDEWLPEALRRRSIEFVVARSENQEHPVLMLWNMLQGSLVSPSPT
ncbi:MAG: hypothetical protein ACXAEI_08190 [Candidatus Hodarchaeales archaeon]